MHTSLWRLAGTLIFFSVSACAAGPVRWEIASDAKTRIKRTQITNTTSLDLHMASPRMECLY